MRIIVLITLTGFLSSCGFGTKKENGHMELSKKNQATVKSVLTRLSESKELYASVIIEEAKSEKFVQFAGNANEGLYFSFPIRQLTADEFEKAQIVLEKFVTEVNEIKLYKDETSTVAAGTLREFNKALEGNVEQGVQLVSTVMVEVLGFEEDVVLNITEN